MPHRTLLLLFLLGLPPILSAQATRYTLKSNTNVGTYTTWLGQVSGKGWFSGNQLFQNDQLYNRGASGTYATGSMGLRLTGNAGWPEAYFQQGGSTSAPISGDYERSVQTSNGSWSTWSRTPNSLFMQVWDVPGRRVSFQVRARCSGTAEAGGHIKVDVGNDSTWEFSTGMDNTTKTRDLAATMPATGTLVVKIEIYGWARSTTRTLPHFSHYVYVKYGYPPRTRAVLTPYGQGCGPTLTGKVEEKSVTHETTVTLQGPAPALPGFLIMGITRLTVPVGGNCFLLTDAIVTLPFYTDFTGRAIRTFPPLTRYHPIKLNFQDALLVGGGVQMSNGLELEFKY